MLVKLNLFLWHAPMGIILIYMPLITGKEMQLAKCGTCYDIT